jgi:predicted O-methyltransferase YrrM
MFVKRLRSYFPGPRSRPGTPTFATHTLRQEGRSGKPEDWAVIGASTIGAVALSPSLQDEAWAVIDQLEPDPYVSYVRELIAEGRRLAGRQWRYADIISALAAATELLRPASYLEVGVRRGRSMAVVAALSTQCSIMGVDLWQPNYAGMANPGPEHVRDELAKVDFAGNLELVTGDSHQILRRLFAERPELSFDLITVDGDHSPRGAARDLRAVLPRLRIGGALVFDDISHPKHPKLACVWKKFVTADRRYSTWAFDDVGYGVAVAVRRW